MELTVPNVETLLKECMFRPEELIPGKEGLEQCPVGALLVSAVMRKVALHPGRVEENREKIVELLKQLPERFDIKVGGGFTFLMACMRRDGIQWGEHIHIEMLISLGMAAKHLRFVMPRDLWMVFPGGVPYFQISLDAGFDTVPDLGVWDGDKENMTSYDGVIEEEAKRMEAEGQENDVAALLHAFKKGADE